MQPSQVPAYQSHQAVQMQAAPPAQAFAPLGPSRYACGAKTLGILQIILAAGSAVAGTVNIIAFSTLSVVACPIWGGLMFYLPAGILGVVSACVSPSSRRCVAVGWMVMSILAAVMAGGNIIYAGISIATDQYYNGTLVMAMDGIVTVVSLAELIIAIVSAVYCCLIRGELPSQNTPTIQYMTAPAYPTTVVTPAPGPPAYAATHAHVVLYRGGATAGPPAPAGYYHPAQNAPNVMMTQPAMPGTVQTVNLPEPKI
ncbi:uncharacterized protein LOC119729054 [Patiria miniata]|uniref:Uncharacterized protein n=1 Tax=Patiria miniata TaxID=46514 RepID=A0A914A1I0_PATMI|nr:uncharacterized protein LOC119729054 [Patiria miniata]